MRIWEVYESPSYEERRGGRGGSSSMGYRGGNRGGGSYNQHDSKESEAYECGYEDGYRDAMTQVYGERSIHRSGTGLGREVYMRGGDEYMPEEDMYNMRRRRDSRGRFM